MNEIIHRSLCAANIPSWLEPSGLYRSDEKRPDGCSILPWRCGNVLVWDATCPDTHAPSHLSAAVRGPGVVAAQAEQLKRAKYAHLDMSHNFVPFVVETSAVLGKQQRTSRETLEDAYVRPQESPAAENSSCIGSQ